MRKLPSIQPLNFLLGHKLACVLVAGIIVRLLLMPISAHSFDVYAWYVHSSDILVNGPFSLQGFPPFWYHYLMVPVAYVYDWLVGVFPAWVGAVPMSSLSSTLDFYPAYNIEVVPGLLFNFVAKFPFLVSDVLLAYLLYKIVGELTGSKGLAEKAALFWFMNPFVIWVSAGWGMWDTLPALFSLAAFYFVLNRKYALSAVCLSLGVALKMYPLLFLVPIAIYLIKTKTSNNQDKWRNLIRFLGVFGGLTILVFLPYIGKCFTFFGDFLFPSAASVDQIIEPLGFGLTYWSLNLLSRFFDLAYCESYVSFMSILSVMFGFVFVGFVYWRIGKFKFQKMAFDLNLAFLLSVIALFLSHRFVCEQFVIWLIPMLIILYVSGKLSGVLYWGVSLVALLYSLLNLPLPFFFLPLAPWVENSLVWMVNNMWEFELVRLVVLLFLGCLFSVLLVWVLFKAVKKFCVFSSSL